MSEKNLLVKNKKLFPDFSFKIDYWSRQSYSTWIIQMIKVIAMNEKAISLELLVFKSWNKSCFLFA